MRQVGIREFQRKLYKVLDEQLPIVVTVNVRKKGTKAQIVKKCIILPYNIQTEIDHDKLESYKQPPVPQTANTSSDYGIAENIPDYPDSLEIEPIEPKTASFENKTTINGGEIEDEQDSIEEVDEKPGFFKRIFKK
jgi:hypothetical protein